MDNNLNNLPCVWQQRPQTSIHICTRRKPEEDPGPMVRRLCLSVGLEVPQNPPRRAGRIVNWGKGSLGIADNGCLRDAVTNKQMKTRSSTKMDF